MSIESRLSKLEVAHGEEYVGLVGLMGERNRGSLIECLDDGFIRLVDHMGGDAAIVQAARVSYGKGTKKKSDDRGLIRYLMRHWHTTPFEMCVFKFHVRVPMDCWRQWIRHRMASVNEYSTRYSEAIDSTQTTPHTEWRLQSGANKQGSSGVLEEEWPDTWDHNRSARTIKGPKTQSKWSVRSKHEMPSTPGEYLTQREEEFQAAARRLYEERISMGVAREVARKDLPLSTYTEAYWKIDLHNLFHFLRLRMDSHAQLEIRTYANAIFKLIEPLAPEACSAFRDYRLEAMQLSGPEIAELRTIMLGHTRIALRLSGREEDEFNAKLVRLGVKDAA